MSQCYNDLCVINENNTSYFYEPCLVAPFKYAWGVMLKMPVAGKWVLDLVLFCSLPL